MGLVPGERGEAAPPESEQCVPQKRLLWWSKGVGSDVFRHTGVPGGKDAAPYQKMRGNPL